MNGFDEERLAALLRRLPPAPEAWVEAARQLPQTRAELDEILERAEADQAFRRALVSDLEAALAAEGYRPRGELVRPLRERLRGS